MNTWILDSKEVRTLEEEAQLLNEILGARQEKLKDLENLATAHDCPALFRNAALDRYLELLREQGKQNQAYELLSALSDYEKEPDDKVRLRAYEWRAELPAIGTRALSSWREKAAQDPSARVRRYASLR